MSYYYLSQDIIEKLEEIKEMPSPISYILSHPDVFSDLYNRLPMDDDVILRWMGGDDNIEVQEIK